MTALPAEVRRLGAMDSPFLIKSAVNDRVLVIIPIRTNLARTISVVANGKISAAWPPQCVLSEYIFYPFDIRFCLIVFCRAAGHIGSLIILTGHNGMLRPNETAAREVSLVDVDIAPGIDRRISSI